MIPTTQHQTTASASAVKLWPCFPIDGQQRPSQMYLSRACGQVHGLVQIKKKQLSGYYFKEPSGRSKVQVMPDGKTSDNPEWLFGKFDQYLAELVGF